MWNMQEFGIQHGLAMTGQSRSTTSRRKELCTWNCVRVVKLSWRTKSSCWTVRRPTPMTTWKPRSTQSTWNPTMTWHTWWTRECARSVSLFSPCSVSVVTLMSCTHRMAQDVRVFVSSHPCIKWAFFLTSFITFIFILSLIITDWKLWWKEVSSKKFEIRTLGPEAEILRRTPWSRTREQNSVYKEFLEIVGNGKPTGSEWKETIAVSATIWISVEKLHHQIRLRILSCSRMSENHREPEVPEEKVPVVECLDGFARITLEELAITHSVKNGTSRMLVPQDEEWLQIWGKVLVCSSSGWWTTL